MWWQAGYNFGKRGADMATMVTMHGQVETEVQQRIVELAEGEGLTADEVIGLLLTQIARKGVLPFKRRGEDFDFGLEDPEYLAWVDARIQEALDDPRPPVSNEEAKRRFAALRAELQAQVQ
jgi:DNA-damage-inducible protein J